MASPGSQSGRFSSGLALWDRREMELRPAGRPSLTSSGEDVGMTVPPIRPKADCFPERETRRARIDGDQLVGPYAGKQCCDQLVADTIAAECWTDVEASHPHRARHNGFNRDAANTGEHVLRTRSEQRFPLTIESDCVRHPVGE